MVKKKMTEQIIITFEKEKNSYIAKIKDNVGTIILKEETIERLAQKINAYLKNILITKEVLEKAVEKGLKDLIKRTGR